MKKLVMLTMIILIATPLYAWAVDDATVQELQTEVSNTKTKADDNENKIRNLEGGLPALETRVTELENGGVQGPPGPEGPMGPAGPTGPQGEQGFTGPAGPIGPQGEQGPQGDIGPAGPQGPPGDVGPQGPVGLTGPVGPQGLQGDVGPQGPQGEQGVAGPQGPQGDIGPMGPVGPQGDIGPMGPQGLQGDPGIAGPVGPEGPMGPQGEQGPQGDIGPAGPQGPPGDVGPQGPIGLTGPAGPQGSNGVDGLHCWDLNADGVPDPEEDINQDGTCDALDCQNNYELRELLNRVLNLEARLFKSDFDSDGFTPETGDCDDSRFDVYPGAVDVVDGVDNDCDGIVDTPGDADFDGLSNQDEAVYGSDVWNPDTDGDGLSDGDEVHLYSTSPTNSDTDNDSLPGEYIVQTSGECLAICPSNPLEPWPHDIFVDINTSESFYGPCAPAYSGQYVSICPPMLSDEIDMSDGREVNVYGTSPTNSDTDGDGVPDGQEIRDNTDPLTAN